MAKRSKKNEPTEATRFSNSAIRKEMIQSAAVRYRHLMQEIEGHKIHIKACRDDIKEFMDKLKDDIGIDRKFFEWTIKNLIEPEEVVRDAIQDTIHEVFEALSPGQQLDWLKPDAPLNQPHQPNGVAPVNLTANVSTEQVDFPV